MRTRPTVIILIALAFDMIFGDPPNRLHPVAWMGNLIAWCQRFRPQNRPGAELAFGAGLLALGGLLVASAGRLASSALSGLPAPLSCLLEAAALKTCFSVRSLDRAAAEIQAALQAGDLAEARRLLSWHLVSRDTSKLDESQTAAAAIESVAENTGDGLVAPLFYYALGGLPLALFYRFANTADSMVGYHTPEYEWLGKIPARLDDLLNAVPARLAGLLLVLSAPLAGGASQRAWQVMRRDASLTESPNAGYPMSAAAGALSVELEKIGHYRLGMGGAKPIAADIARARRLLLAASGLGATALALLALLLNRRDS